MQRETHGEIQKLVQAAVAFALQVSVGAALLGYSYPGQTGFLCGQKGPESDSQWEE